MVTSVVWLHLVQWVAAWISFTVSGLRLHRSQRWPHVEHISMSTRSDWSLHMVEIMCAAEWDANVSQSM